MPHWRREPPVVAWGSGSNQFSVILHIRSLPASSVTPLRIMKSIHSIIVRHLPVLLGIIIGLHGSAGIARAQLPGQDLPGAEVLTRGPVHEAFAEVVAYNPEPGIVVSKGPPEAIEEMPPDERPEGANITWIPGYWGWDDERSDFIWISGTWRALPPGRQWIAGYWGRTTQGYQWVSGYWADATVREAVYLPPPPASLEAGPNIAAPSVEFVWAPGCWVWQTSRYAWRPGYWVRGRADWNWCPPRYAWTPRGHIFVAGYWDYPVHRRGVIFAPVHFQPAFFAQRRFHYSPFIAININVFTDHLFVRPRYHHCYFGDYYAPSYSQGGFYASFSFQSGRHGYDPIYSHNRWEHRRDRDWEHRVTTTYQYRRDHESARPPHTWEAQRRINPGTVAAREDRVVIAAPISQMAKRTDGPVRFQSVSRDERERYTHREREVQVVREERRTIEERTVETTIRRPGGTVEPPKVQLPRSPIVARTSDLGRSQAPPKPPTTPRPDTKIQPRQEPPTGITGTDRNRSGPDPLRPEPGRRPDRSDAPAPGQPAATASQQENERKAREESQRRATEAAAEKAREDARKANAAEQARQSEAQRKAKEAEMKGKTDAQKAAQEQENRNRLDAQRKANEAAERAREDARNKPKAADQGTAAEAQRKANEAAEKARNDARNKAQTAEQARQQEALRKAKEAEMKAQSDAQKAARDQENRNRLDAQRKANEAAEKAKNDARNKAQAAEQARQQETQRKAKEAEMKAQAEAQKAAREQENRNRQDTQRRANEAAEKAKADARNQAQAAEQARQQESQRKAKEAEMKAQAEAQKAAREQENRNRQDAQRRANEAAEKAKADARNQAQAAEQARQVESQRKAAEAEQKARDAQRGKKKKDSDNP
jgi:hypothetical protein